MKQKTTLFLALLISIFCYSQTVIIPTDSDWNYLDDGSNQGTAWYGTGFDDSSWTQNKPAELGYGDGDEATVIGFGPDKDNKYPTTYFRKTFNVADASLFNDIELKALRDDGMVVYLNGVEVWRDNMPATSNYLSYSSGATFGSAEDTYYSKILASSLVTGNNVLAVEVHQVNASSSDVSFNFELLGYASLPAGIIRGPYLQTGTPTSAIIKWRTNTNTESIINYGLALGALTSVVQDNIEKKDHEITISGLLPNTKYYYEIADAEGVYLAESSDMYVKTAPNVGEKQFTRAWILGDAGTANQDQRDVRDAYYNYVSSPATVNPDQTDMMLFLGDNAYNDGTDAQYQNAFFNIYDDMLKKSVSWSTLGNHDGYTASSNTQSGPYYDIFSFPKAAEAGGIASNTEAYYSFDYANIHFIVLESYTLENNQAQIDWCTQDMQATTQDWIVAIFHHPAYTKGSHDSDTESNPKAMRANFLPILEANGVDLVLNGHSHSYERSFFLNGHYGLSSTFDATTNTVGANGDLSGNENTDGAYTKQPEDTEGAVYITTGSAGKISGGSLNHNAMYASINELGSCVLEIENDMPSDGQNLNVKFLNDNGATTDYFTINKPRLLEALSTEDNIVTENAIKVYPVPANAEINIELRANETLENVKIYNMTGALIKESSALKIDVSTIAAGTYMLSLKTNKNTVYKTIVIE